jgi:hypothetical protein
VQRKRLLLLRLLLRRLLKMGKWGLYGSWNVVAARPMVSLIFAASDGV